ncbi:MAG: aminodeoxychorismate lyase [Acetatifactor sp.]
MVKGKIANVVMTVLGLALKVALIVLAVAYIYKGAMICYDYGYRIFTEPAVSPGEGRIITVAVTEDMSPKEIGQLFENKGLVKDGRLFMFQYYLSEYKKDVKPGIFNLSTAMTAEEMMAVMAAEDEESEETGEEK